MSFIKLAHYCVQWRALAGVSGVETLSFTVRYSITSQISSEVA